MPKIFSSTLQKPILIIGLGNPILGDDGVGWKIAEQVNKYLINQPDSNQLPAWEIDYLCVGGLSLMERMVGYDTVLLIDAILLEDPSEGNVVCLSLDDIPNRAWGHLTSSHDTTLQNALEIGHRMGVHLPQTIWIIGIETRHVFEFSEQLSQPVAEAVPKAVEEVVKRLTTSHIITI